MSAPFGSQSSQETTETVAQKPSGLIDSNITVTNPGSYEELHKKTKGFTKEIE